MLRTQGATLDAPGTCPDNLVSAEQLPGFLCDLADAKLRVRCTIYEVVGNYHMKPHLHHVELRRRGIRPADAHELRVPAGRGPWGHSDAAAYIPWEEITSTNEIYEVASG